MFPENRCLFTALMLLSIAARVAAAQRPDGDSAYANATFVLDGSVEGAFKNSTILAERMENVPESVRSRFPLGVSKTSAFSLRSRGGLANRFFLDVDWKRDDKNPEADDDSRIVLRYQGRPGEFLKELELGDTTLDLPGARWLGKKGKNGGVSRQSFAGKGKFSLRDLTFTFIGAHQKGRPEREEFRLGASVRRAAIRDVDYIQRRFYPAAPETDLPIEPGSLKVYLDDGNGTNNGPATQRFVPEGGAEAGDYDLLVAGERKGGYEFDPRRGVIQFFSEITYPSSLVVSYRTAAGREVLRKEIKSRDDSAGSELKNRYLLPADLRDVAEITLESPSGGIVLPPAYELDPISQLLIFQSTRPFKPPVYSFPPAHSQTILLSYLSDGAAAAVTLSREPLPGTLSVKLNGRVLAEGTDYSFTPESGGGKITLYHAGTGDLVEAEYESKSAPRARQTVGGALTLGEEKPVRLDISGLADFAPRPSRAPDLGNDAASVRMIGAALKGRQPLAEGSVAFNFEAAGSEYNPNPFGASIVENMDRSRRVLPVELREEFWKHSSKKPATSGLRSRGTAEFSSILAREIVPSNPSERREQMLSFAAGALEWSGFMRALASRRGALDLRAYRELELFVRANGGGRLVIDLGDLSEDANGNGALESEDANGDGLLDSAEDGGVPLEDGRIVGAGNRLLDGEDIDLDGRLNLHESVLSRSFDLGWTGWRKLHIPLEGTRSARFLRFVLEDAGEAAVAQLQFTGTDYTEEVSPGASLSIGVVSNFGDPQAPTLSGHPLFRRLYPDRFEERSDRSEEESARLEEFALALDYALPPGGEVAARREARLDFSDQRVIHWFAASTAASNAVLFLRLGSARDYFEYEIAANQLSPDYREFAIHRDRFRKVGSPDWKEVREIRIGLRNPSAVPESGRVYFNELFVDDPVIRRAFACLGEMEGRHPLSPFLSFSPDIFGKGAEIFWEGDFSSVPPDFRTPDEFLRGEERYNAAAGLRAERLKLRYARGESRQAEHFLANGRGWSRFSPAFSRSERVEWNARPAPGGWRGEISGNFEKHERREIQLGEKTESAGQKIDIDSSGGAFWLPERTTVDALWRRDLVLGRKSYGGTLQNRWRFFDSALGFSPRAVFEETIQSSTSFVLSRKSVLGAAVDAAWKNLSSEITAQSENTLQRSGFPSLNFYSTIGGDVTLREGLFGRSVLSGSAAERRITRSTGALGDARAVWKYAFVPSPHEEDSFERSREGGFAQEEVRLLPLAGLRSCDWFSLTFRMKASQLERRTFHLPWREESVHFPDLTLVFSTGAWRASLGGSRERRSGRDRQSLNDQFPVGLDYRGQNWELRNSLSLRREREREFEMESARTETIQARTRLAFTLASPFYKTFRRIRKNAALANRLDCALEAEGEKRSGRERSRDVDETTLTLLERLDYFLKDELSVYLLLDGRRFQNRLAGTMNYFAYAVSLGVKAAF